jgi:hypothetical protein
VSWRDLREWIALLERNNELQRITKPVDADEELGAITYMATRNENAAALLFENIAGDRSGSSVLANMLGASKERYALAVGLDPDLSIAEMIAESRTIMNRRIAPVRIPKSKAPVNDVVLTGDAIDLTAFPAPKFWPGRHRPHQRRLLPADAAWAAPRRALLLARQARRARPRGVVEARQAVRSGCRLRRRSRAVHAGSAGVRLEGIRVRRCRRHDGPRH